MRSAQQIYGQALRGDAAAVRFGDGLRSELPVARYLGPVSAAERRLLEQVVGPVLDVGCGPGRLLHALAARDVFALGVDLSAAAVELALSGGAQAIMVGDVFGELPGAGSWQTALLLDGNIGIGGSPVRLLARLRTLLHADGLALVEVEPPSARIGAAVARLEIGGQISDWFPWARVSAAEIGRVAAGARMCVQRLWCLEGRWFAQLAALATAAGADHGR